MRAIDVLRWIRDHPGVTAREIAAATCAQPKSVRRVLVQYEALGYVRRGPSLLREGRAGRREYTYFRTP